MIWLACSRLFDLRLPLYYALLFAIQIASACTLVWIMSELLPGRLVLPYLAGVFLLIWPTDQTRLWLSTYAYRFGLLCLLNSVVLSLRSVRRRSRWCVALSVEVYALAILSNEIYLPLAVAPILASGTGQDRSWRTLLRIGLPYTVVALVYVIVRLALPALTSLVDAKIGLWQPSLMNILANLWRAGKVNFASAWSYSFLRLQTLPREGLLAVAASVVVFLAVWGLRTRLEKPLHNATHCAVNATFRIHQDFCLFAVGLVLMFLGYMVVLPTAYHASVGSIDSRINIAASLGGAVALAGLVEAMGDALLRWTGKCGIEGSVALVVVPLVALAVSQQVAVGADYRECWAEQTNIWRSMFAQIPTLEPDACVVIAGVPRWQNATNILTSRHEVQCALRLLYGMDTLCGDLLPLDEMPVSDHEGDRSHIRFGQSHLVPRLQDTPVHYDHLVLVEYMPEAGVRIAYEAPDWVPAGLTEVYTHVAVVRDHEASTRFRTLVESGPTIEGVMR